MLQFWPKSGGMIVPLARMRQSDVATMLNRAVGRPKNSGGGQKKPKSGGGIGPLFPM